MEGAYSANRPVELLLATDFHFTDLDEMAASPLAWDQKYEQIGRGRFSGRISQVVLNTLQAGRTAWQPGIMQQGSAPPNCWAIGFPVERQGSVHLRGREVAADQPMIVAPGEDIAFVATAPTELVLVAQPVDELQRWMDIRRGAGLDKRDLKRPWRIEPAEIASRGAALVRLISMLLDSGGAPPSPAMVKSVEARMVDLVLGIVPSSDIAEPLHRRARVALKLRDLLRGHTHTPLTVTEMCQLLGVRERTLALSSVEAFGRPPKALLLELRLNGVRRALQQPKAGDTVTEVATRFGFLHFGHFSAEYKRQFGELPSATLARAAGPAPKAMA